MDYFTYPKEKTTFREEYSYDYRKSLSQQLRNDHIGTLPIIVERSNHEKYLPKIKNRRFLAPEVMTLASFFYVIQSRLSLSPEQSVCLYSGFNLLGNRNMTMADVYNKFSDKDGFLYIQYRSEDPFG